MEDHYILNDDHTVRKVPFMVWAEWFEQTDKRLVAVNKTRFFAISTIFLGLNHNFSDIGPPVLFETMVFEREAKVTEFNGRLFRYRPSVDQLRYSTWDDAVAGHDTAFKRLLAQEAKASKKSNEISTIRDKQ